MSILLCIINKIKLYWCKIWQLTLIIIQTTQKHVKHKILVRVYGVNDCVTM